MSGPKCASYRIDPAVLAEARRRMAALDVRDDLIDRIAMLETVLAARRGAGLADAPEWQLAGVSPSAAAAEIEAWNVQAGRALDRAESELAEVERSERQQDIRDKVAAVASGASAELIRRQAAAAAGAGAGEPRRADESEAPDAPAADEDDRQAEIDLLVDRLPLGATAQERDAIEEQISELARAATAEFGSRLVGVKAEMQRIERDIAARAETSRRAEQLLRTLDGLEGADIVESRGLLQRALSGETALLDSDVERVVRARSAAAADFERRLVATKIEEALRLSGIEVGAGFATDVVDGEKAYAAARSSDEHAVEFRLRDGLVDMRLVRASGASDARRDTEAEIEFCKDVGRVSSTLHSQGVDLRLVSNQPPGASAVEIVPRAQSALAQRRSSRAKPLERRRKR